MKLTETNASPETAELRDSLTTEHQVMRERTIALMEACGRAPNDIDDGDEATASKVAEFIKRCQKHMGEIEKARKERKRPVLNQGNLIDVFFNNMAGDLRNQLAGVRSTLSNYLERKAAEEERAARRAAEQARLREAEAREAEEQAKRQGDMERAIQAREQAVGAEIQQRDLAQKKPEDHGKVRNETGKGQAALKKKWVCNGYDRTELDLEALRHYFSGPEIEAAIKRFIAAGNHKLAGAAIEQEAQSVVR